MEMKRTQIKRKNPNKVTEKSIMLGIMQALGFKDWYVIRMPPSIYTSGKGIPDLYACKQGVSVWIEVKTEKGKLSPSQERITRLLDEAGATVIIARSVDYAIEKAEDAYINNQLTCRQ